MMNTKEVCASVISDGIMTSLFISLSLFSLFVILFVVVYYKQLQQIHSQLIQIKNTIERDGAIMIALNKKG